MSWPLRKSSSSSIANGPTGINRQTTGSVSSSSASVGVVPRVVQLDFDKEEKKIQQLEAANKKFYKDVKCYVEKIDELNKSESKMINNLTNLTNSAASSFPSNVALTASSSSSNQSSNAQSLTNLNVSLSNQNTASCSESSASSSSSSSSTSATNSLSQSNNSSNNFNDFTEFINRLKLWKDLFHDHSQSCDSLKQLCQNQVIEPMKKLNLIFPQVHEAIKRRQNAYNELVKQQAKLDKALEKERTGVQLVKIEELKNLVSVAKQQFQREHSLLMEELPKLYNSRVDYIRPCVNSMLQGQADFYDSYSKFYESILSCNLTKHAQHSTQSLKQKQTSNDQHIYANHLIDQFDDENNPLFDVESNDNLNKEINSTQTIDQIDDEIQKCLNEIKSLSIVAGD